MKDATAEWVLWGIFAVQTVLIALREYDVRRLQRRHEELRRIEREHLDAEERTRGRGQRVEGRS